MRKAALGAALVLGSLLAATGAGASPDYVKICSLYGEGWYYLPGSDICVKANTGETRQQTEFGTRFGQTELASRVGDTESAIADLQRRFDSAFQDQSDQSAIAAALADPDLVAGEHFGVKFNWGNPGEANAFGVTFAGVVAETDNMRVTLTGGVATTGRNTGGRAGVQFSW